MWTHSIPFGSLTTLIDLEPNGPATIATCEGGPDFSHVLNGCESDIILGD